MVVCRRRNERGGRLHRLPGVATTVALLCVASACSPNGDSDGDGARAGDASASAADSAAATTSTSPSDRDVSPTIDAAVLDSSLPPEPTGVPGINAADGFCAAWAQYAGSVQIIAVAAAFGEGGPAGVAELEVASHAVMLTALDEIASGWPEELAGEQTLVINDRLGPLRRRLTAVAEVSLAAGVDAQGQLALTSGWQTLLATRDSENPSPTVPLDPTAVGVDAALAAAAAAVVATLPPFSNDPTLNVSAVETPLTDGYLADNCEALAGSGVGDDV
jgi:hypothetical protein